MRILRGEPWSLLPLRTWPRAIDLIIFAAGLALFYRFDHSGSYMAGPGDAPGGNRPHRVRRGLERQRHRRILPFEGADILDRGT
jgi:hypothetical protein